MKNLPKKRFHRAFTLVEIMVVVLVIGILVSIGLPIFLRLRINANEELVRADLRSFGVANEGYRAMRNPPVYAPDIPALINDNYLDTTWLNPGNKHGYIFSYAIAGNRDTYSVEANVLTPNVTGVNYYCVDNTGVIVRGPTTGLGTSSGCVGGSPIGS
ncbi:MAG: prepilin-type N-terminal cleavage/methylation domain-containing protein [Candidatus Omnitrophica bacterium]|nr:prepilin-type N-terminal cleavage/methylation domain-containing protein [Candidatus Omnitrophota bacterium]